MYRILTGWFSCLLVVASLAGCFHTSVRPAQPVPAGPTTEARQWFTVGGLVGLSDAAGSECGAAGLAFADSRMGGTDILINIGLTVAGSMLGTAVCNSDSDPVAYASCVQGMAALVPFLISSRTVSYACAAPAGASGQLPRIPSPRRSAETTSDDQAAQSD
jgi:hypothetical protein